MAKAKSSDSAKPPTKTATKRKTPPPKTGEDSSPAKKTSIESQPAFSNERIGHVAGELWQLLDQQGGHSLAAIKKATGASNDLALAAIGWLAREDKLEFTTNGRTVTISLRQ